MFRQAWEGNDPFRGKLILMFDAKYNAKEEVYKPVRILQKMASPGVESFLIEDIRVLTPPLPVPKQPSNGITIGIGNMFEYVGCLFTSVVPTWYQAKDTTGYPIHADVEVNYQLVNPVTKGDFPE